MFNFQFLMNERRKELIFRKLKIYKSTALYTPIYYYKHLIEQLKNSLSVGNRSVGTISNLNFDKLKEAKEVIISIRNELEFHQKQTIKCAILAGQSLTKIQDLCQIENKKFIDFLREFGINWSRSYIQFLISLYIFSKEYPKICNLSVPLYFIKNNFKRIKLANLSSDVERKY